MRHIVFWIVLLLVSITLPPDSYGLEKNAASLAKSEMSTSWIGIDSDGIHQARLRLSEDGTAHFAYSLTDHPAVSLPVEGWIYHNGQLSLGLAPNDDYLSLTGSVAGSDLRLHLRGRDWVVQFRMLRERELVERWCNLLAADPREGRKAEACGALLVELASPPYPESPSSP